MHNTQHPFLMPLLQVSPLQEEEILKYIHELMGEIFMRGVNFLLQFSETTEHSEIFPNKMQGFILFSQGSCRFCVNSHHDPLIK